MLHTARFAVVRRLGAGATGVVYEAENRKSGERIALKALSRIDASSLYRFKREFRALSGVSHPNLVTLNELFHEEGNWFLSMELVRGQSFVEHIRGVRNEPDLARLRSALAQLVRAVHALHEAGRLHRDLKPSNVLVTEQGRVVVLDFGFVRELGADAPVEAFEVLGTPAYMAPEQADLGGGQLASDWYSVGVMLFEALTGRLPFEGSTAPVLVEKLKRPAPNVRSLWPWVPLDLEQLCDQLLLRDPSQRPTGRALLGRVGAPAAEWRSAIVSTDLFVGRTRELEQLHTALDHARRGGMPRVVTLIGPSAVGKSALIERFASEVGERGAWVLLGRCHEREDVPYKALDGIVDALARRLGELCEAELALLFSRYLGALALQFPVLLRVPALARQAARYVRPADPHELRRQAASALHELLARIADHRTLILLIDDLQWGDVDSVHMLRDALSPEDVPGVLFVAVARDDSRATSPAVVAFTEAFQGLRRRGQLETLTLEPLPRGEAEELAGKLLGPRAADRGLLQHVVMEADGLPLFIQELARHALTGGSPTSTIEQLVQLRLTRLSSAALELLELVTIASAPLSLAVARELLEQLDLESILRELLHEHLVRQTFHPVESLDTRHAQIRAIIKRMLPPERASELHLRLARQLAAHGADPELLAHHFMSAGDPARAASYAARAAVAAAAALAFSAAARCYELALSWGEYSTDERGMLMLGLAEALANAGRGHEAGDAFVRAAEYAGAEQRLRLRARAVDQLLRAGHIEAGLALGDELLGELGLAPAQTGGRALAELVARRAWLWVRGYRFTRKERTDMEPGALIKVEAARAMSLGLGHMDPFAAATMQARHLTLALHSGDTFSVARALGYESVYVGIEGAAHSDKAIAMLARQRDLCEKPLHPYLKALDHYARGVVEWGRGAWLPALNELDNAENIYRHDLIGASWEILAAQLIAFGCLSFLGRFDELRRRVVRIAEEARIGDDRLTLQWVLAWQAIVETLRGDPSAAKQAILGARARLPEQHYTLPHLFALHAATCMSLYAADGHVAYARLTREWPAMKRSQLLRIQVYRVEMLRLRAASALCAAAADPVARRVLHTAVERDLERIDREDVPWASAVALALRGELHIQQGALDQARHAWTLAEERLSAVQMESSAAATRRCLGLLLGGDAGEVLVRTADDWLVRHGVTDPERGTWLHVGGYHQTPRRS